MAGPSTSPQKSPQKSKPSGANMHSLNTQQPVVKAKSKTDSIFSNDSSDKTSPIMVPSPTESEKRIIRMFKSGQKQLQSSLIHVYTVKATDLRTGNSLENHKNLLRQQIVDKLGSTVKKIYVGNMTFIAKGDWTFKIKGSVTDPTNQVVLVELLESTDDKSCLEVKCLTDVNKVITLADFAKKGSAHKARWFKFVALDIRQLAGHGLQQLRDACGWDLGSQGRASGLHRCFALTFTRDSFNLADIQEPFQLPARNVLDHFAGSELARHLEAALDLDPLLLRGAHVIGPVEKTESGIEYRPRLEASLVLTKDGTSPLIDFKERASAAFLPETTVADFLVDHFGCQASCGLDDHLLAKASKIFKGVRVCVAVVAADRPVVTTAHSLVGSARWNPESLFGTLAGTSSIECLRFPDLPCINVGSEEKPFLYPAEFCKILPDQPYSGPRSGPLQIEPATFNTTPLVLKAHAPKSSDSNPFSDVGETDFTFIFVRLVGPAGTSSPSAIAWKDFQHELGQRFNGKLLTSVLGAKHFSGDLEQLRDQLMHKGYCSAGVKTVVLIAAPASVPTSELDAFKAFCDTKIGAQVQVVAAAEINRRCKRDAENRRMVMYTGQVARKIFARALIPGLPDAGSVLSLELSSKAQKISTSSVFGIKVGPLGQHNNADGGGKSYLITVVSKVGSLTKSVSTSTIPFTVSSESTLVDQGIPEAFRAAIQENKPVLPTETTTVYISGLPETDRSQIIRLTTALRAELPKSHHGKAEHASFTLLAMAPEPRVSVLTAEPASKGSSDDGNDSAIDKKSPVSHLVLAQVYRKPAGYHNADGSLKEGTKLWRTDRGKITLPNTLVKLEEFFSKAREPSILQLAAKANKRSMGRVVKADGKYKVLDVKESLKGTLWYL